VVGFNGGVLELCHVREGDAQVDVPELEKFRGSWHGRFKMFLVFTIANNPRPQSTHQHTTTPQTHATLNCAYSRRRRGVAPPASLTMTVEQQLSPQTHASRPILDPANTFTASWSPSKATALDPTSLPIAKTHRAWERAAQSPQAENSRVKKVWKRYEFRSGQDETVAELVPEVLQEEEEEQDSPVRIVKKLRVKSPHKRSEFDQEDKQDERNHAATRWDKRRGGLRRMLQPVRTIYVRAYAKNCSGKHPLPPESNATSCVDGPSITVVKAQRDDEEINSSSLGNESFDHDDFTSDQASESPNYPILNLDIVLSAEGQLFHSIEPSLDLEIDREQDIFDIGTHDELPQSDPSEEQLQTEAAEALDREVVVNQIASTTPTSPQPREIEEPSDVSYPALDVLCAYPPSDEETPQEETPEKLCGHVLEPATMSTDVVGALFQEQSQSNSIQMLSLTSAPNMGGDMSPEKALEQEEMATPSPVHSTPRVPTVASTPKHKSSSPVDSKCVSPDEELDPASPTINLNALISSNQTSSLNIAVPSPQEDVHYPGLTDEDTTTFDDELPAQDDDADELSMDLESTETFTFNTDATTTTTLLEDDKAILRSFLNRAAANKANKSASITRRESLQNRRDSDAIRHALASPRHVLEEKDSNRSPHRSLGVSTQPQSLAAALYSPFMKRSGQDAGLDESQTLTATNDKLEDELAGMENQNGSPRRRSTRARTKIPQLPSAAAVLASTPNKIPVRTDGGERVVLNRSEAQLMMDLVRKNTKKNKFNAKDRTVRLKQLKAEALTTTPDGSPSEKVTNEISKKSKIVQWRENLTEFSDDPPNAEPELSDESASGDVAKKSKIPSTGGRNVRIEASGGTAKESQRTPRLRRLKGLGATNGTPGKNLLSSTLLPDEVQEEFAEIVQTRRAGSKSKSTPAPDERSTASEPDADENDKPAKTIKKTKVPAPSKLQQPKKLVLNPSVTSLSGLPVLAGKENVSQLLSPAKKLPAKGRIPLPASSSITASMLPVDAKPVKRQRITRNVKG
jgi:hypothetical protein